MDEESQEFVGKKSLELKMEFMGDFEDFLSDIAKDIANRIANLGTSQIQLILMNEVLLNGCAYCIAKCVATYDEETTKAVLEGLIEQTYLFKKTVLEKHEENKKETKSLPE